MRVLALLLVLLPASQETAIVSGKVSSPPVPAKRLKARYVPERLAGHKPAPPSPPVVWLEGPAASKVEGRRVEMLQEGLQFRPRVLAVQAGTTVGFPNGDDLQHNVLSYSRARRFDLGRYAKGESKEVTFDQAGVVEINCEVHEHMRGFVVVVDHACFTVAKDDGSFTLPAVAPGKYTLVAWREGFEPLKREIDVTAKGLSLDLQIARGPDGAAGPAGGCCR